MPFNLYTTSPKNVYLPPLVVLCQGLVGEAHSSKVNFSRISHRIQRCISSYIR